MWSQLNVVDRFIFLQFYDRIKTTTTTSITQFVRLLNWVMNNGVIDTGLDRSHTKTDDFT